MSDSYEPRQLLEKWYREVAIRARVHYLAAGRFENRRLWIGGSASVLSAVVGTSVFTTLSENQATLITLGTGLISIAVVVLAAMQTILRYPEQATSHHRAAADFGDIRDLIEQDLANDKRTPISEDKLNNIRERKAAARKDAPVPPKDLWSKAEQELINEEQI